MPSPPASRNIHPPCACAAARAARSASAESAATCTVPTPSSAHQPHAGAREVGARARGSRRARPRSDRGARRPGAPARSAAVIVRPWASTSAGAPSSSTCTSATVPEHARPGGTSRAAVVAGGTTARTRARGRQRSVACTSTPERAERADEEPRQVVAGDVLDRRSAALHDASVAGDEVALRARGRAAGRAAGGARPDSPAREDAADRRALGRAGRAGTPGRARRAIASSVGERRAARRR